MWLCTAQRLTFEGLEKDAAITTAGSKYHNNPTQFALDRFAYYPCHKCQNPFFGGMRQCEEAAQQNEQKVGPGSCSWPF